jgi:hypothetical protein
MKTNFYFSNILFKMYANFERVSLPKSLTSLKRLKDQKVASHT